MSYIWRSNRFVVRRVCYILLVRYRIVFGDANFGNNLDLLPVSFCYEH